MYHQLLKDGTRDEKASGKLDSRNFSYDGLYYGVFADNLPVYDSYVDSRGFNIDGIFVLNLNGENTPYDIKQFDVDGYYYELMPDGTYVKTDKKYDKNYFNRDGYYYELQKDGTRVKTENKISPEGIDSNGFDQNGIHVVTKLEYDENYFRKDGLNVITTTSYSLRGFDINGNYSPRKVSRYLSKYVYSEDKEELECVSIAKRALKLPFEKRSMALKESFKNDKKKYMQKYVLGEKTLNERLYKYIVVAAAIDQDVKEMLTDYLLKLVEEIRKLSIELENEMSKANKNMTLIKDYDKKIESYKEMKSKIEIGGMSGRNI